MPVGADAPAPTGADRAASVLGATGRRASLPWTLRLARWTRRLALPLLLVGVVSLWHGYGMLTVPAGMDTLPETHPPGTRCLVAKHPRHLVAGAVVFAEVAAGTVLGRIAAVDGEMLLLAADNQASRYAAWLPTHVPRRAVRGLVLVTFLPEPKVPLGR